RVAPSLVRASAPSLVRKSRAFAGARIPSRTPCPRESLLARHLTPASWSPARASLSSPPHRRLRGQAAPPRIGKAHVNGFVATLIKEFAHIRREPITLFFAFVIPVFELTIFGYAIDMDVDRISTVVLNLDGRQESREILHAFANTRT